MTFYEYVAGKTIAIVGPAPVRYDQSAEIDAHDIVYRTSYGFGWRSGMDPSPAGDCWTPGVFPRGTGTRVDMSFYNGMATRQAAEGALDRLYVDLDWAVHKFRPDYESPLTNIRWVQTWPNIKGRRVQPNQVTLMLWDLMGMDVADVTVFGADFYMGTSDTWYDPDYMQPGWDLAYDDPTEAFARGAAFEDQEDQRQVIRTIREQFGWPNGDERFLEALYTSPEEHYALMDAERLRHAKLRGKA
jgi:hypothetical protein